MTPSIHEPQDLQRSALLRRLSELDRLEPSPQLDRAVMERARKMIRPARAARVRHALGWTAAAVLTAALAVLATSTTLRHELLGGPWKSPSPAHNAVARSQANPPHASGVPPASGPRIFELQDVSSTVRRAVPPSSALVPTEATEAYSRRVIVGARPAALETRPAEWLAEIRKLRAEGRTAEALREWTAFRKAYPGYPGYPGHPGYRDSIPGELDPLTTTRPSGVDPLTTARPGK